MNRRRFSYSITSIGIVIALLTFVVALAVLGSVAFYFRDQFRRQYLDYTVRVQTQFNIDAAMSFRTLEQQLFMLGLSDANISLINTTKNDQTFYRAKMAVYNELSNLWPPFNAIDGLFFYSPIADDYTPYVVRSASAECSNYIRSLLKNTDNYLNAISGLSRQWNLVALDRGAYLVSLIPSGSSVLGGVGQPARAAERLPPVAAGGERRLHAGRGAPAAASGPVPRLSV